jgi:hypothetical protein
MSADLRAINDYRRQAFGHEPGRRIAFVCECADDGCRRAVLMTAAEFDEARASRRPVVLYAAHASPDDPGS